jgi:biotin synthase-like enzyme
MAAVKLLSDEEKYTAAQKNRVHFKNQAIKFSSILCFVNVDFDIIFVNRL